MWPVLALRGVIMDTSRMIVIATGTVLITTATGTIVTGTVVLEIGDIADGKIVIV